MNTTSSGWYLWFVGPGVSRSGIEAEGDRALEARQRVRVRTWWLPVLRFLAGAGAGIGVASLLAFVLVYGFFYLARP
jgi:hypothetical protein